MDEEVGVRMISLFDHEEIGSASAQGAGSPVFIDTLQRVTTQFSAADSKVRHLILFHRKKLGVLFKTEFLGTRICNIGCVVRRLKCCGGFTHQGVFEQGVQKSFLVSADMAHSLHPNYMVSAPQALHRLF